MLDEIDIEELIQGKLLTIIKNININNILEITKTEPATIPIREINPDFFNKNFSIIFPTEKIVSESFKNQKVDENELLVTENTDDSVAPEQLERSFIDQVFVSKTKYLKFVSYEIQVQKKISELDIKTLTKFTYQRINYLYDFNNLKSVSFNDISNKIVLSNFANINLYNSILFLSFFNRIFDKILIKFKVDESKYFSVRLYIEGRPKIVYLDTQIPLLNEGGKKFVPAFLNPEPQNYWILVIEKAIAKINQSYANTIRMLASEIFILLTHIPLFTYYHNITKKGFLWNLFFEAPHNEWVIFAEFNQNEEKMELLEKGMFAVESYLSFFIVRAFEVHGDKYLELIIPHFKDRIVFEYLKKKLQNDIPENYFINNSSYFSDNSKNLSFIFYITFNSYIKYFQKTCLLKYFPKYEYSFKKYPTTVNKYQVVKFSLKNKNHIILSMHLKTTRYFHKIKNYETPLSRLVIAKSNELLKGGKFKLEYIDSAFSKEETLHLDLNLNTGTYYVFFKNYSEYEIKVILSIYAPLKIEMTKVHNIIELNNFKEGLNLYNTAQSLFNSLIETKGIIQNIEDCEDLKFSYLLKNERNIGYSIVKIENNTTNVLLNIILSYDVKGMKIITHDETKNKKFKSIKKPIDELDLEIYNSQELYLSIPPLSSEIVVFEWEKREEEVDIKIHPQFSMVNYFPFEEKINKELVNYPINYITKKVIYYEISYKRGIYILIINKSSKEYTLTIKFEKLKNLVIILPITMKKEFDINLKGKSKEIIYLKSQNDEEVFYKINFYLNVMEENEKV